MSLSIATTTRSSQPLVSTLLAPTPLGRELVTFSPATEEGTSAELVSQMFSVLSLQNEEVRDEAERNYSAFQRNQQQMRETLQTLTEESRRLQAELTATLGRYNELQTMTETEKRAFQASIQRLTEEMRIKNEQIARLDARIRDLETIRTTYQTSVQTLTVENGQLRAELTTQRAQAAQHIASLQALITAQENQKNAEIASVTKQRDDRQSVISRINQTLSEVNQPENDGVSLLKRRIKYNYPAPNEIVVENTTFKQVMNDLNNHFGILGGYIDSVPKELYKNCTIQ